MNHNKPKHLYTIALKVNTININIEQKIEEQKKVFDNIKYSLSYCE